MNLFYYGDYSDPIEGDEGKEGPLSALESNRGLRNAALCHARSHVGKLQSDDAMRTQFRGTCLDILEFKVDLLQLYLHVPIRGACFQCGSDQPVEPIQLRCLKCGKGGAR